MAAALHESLSDRELQVFLRLAKGESVTDIANVLALSVKTISTYRSRLLEKLEVASNAELAAYALRHGLMVDEVRSNVTGQPRSRVSSGCS